MKRPEIVTPVVTAFDKNGNIDIKANEKIYDYLIESRVDGIAVMGSTGEFFTISFEQKKLLIETALKHIAGRVKVYIGTNCPTVEETITLSNFALNAGADAVMIIQPYYFALSDASLEAYFDTLLSAINGNVILYNFPARTGSDINPALVLNLLRKHANIMGYKDTVSEMGHTRRLLDTVHTEFPEFKVYSGFDEFLVLNVLSGGVGCIGGLSNIFPEIFADWNHAIENEDAESIARIQKIINHLMGLYEISSTFIPILKKAMILRGIDMQDVSTAPLLPATESETAQIQALLNDYEKMSRNGL